MRSIEPAHRHDRHHRRQRKLAGEAADLALARDAAPRSTGSSAAIGSATSNPTAAHRALQVLGGGHPGTYSTVTVSVAWFATARMTPFTPIRARSSGATLGA